MCPLQYLERYRMLLEWRCCHFCPFLILESMTGAYLCGAWMVPAHMMHAWARLKFWPSPFCSCTIQFWFDFLCSVHALIDSGVILSIQGEITGVKQPSLNLNDFILFKYCLNQKTLLSIIWTNWYHSNIVWTKKYCLSII